MCLLYVQGLQNIKNRDGVLLRFYLDMNTWASKQVMTLLIREGRRDPVFVESLPYNSFSFNTLSARNSEKTYSELSLSEDKPLCVHFTIHTSKMLCTKYVSTVILYI